MFKLISWGLSSLGGRLFVTYENESYFTLSCICYFGAIGTILSHPLPIVQKGTINKCSHLELDKAHFTA